MDIFGFGKPDPKTDPEPPKDDPNKGIMEAITSLKGDLDTINTRLDEFDTKLTASTETPDEHEEGWKPKTWDEIPQKAEEIASSVVDQKLQERDKQVQDTSKAEQAKQKAMDTFIDNQMVDLEKSGVLPKMENPNDDNDAGRAARRELLGFAGRIGTMDLHHASEVLKEFHDSGKSYDPRANNGQGAFLRSGTTPAGINAPVSSSNRPMGNVSSKPDYKTLHNSSMDTLIRANMPE